VDTKVAREFQIFPDLGGSFRVRVVDTSNGKTLMSSEAYYNHGNAKRFAEREASLQLDGGRVVDLSTEEERKAGWWKRFWS
jgi:uncharacterized protein YegP (UPF0339 family)